MRHFKILGLTILLFLGSCSKDSEGDNEDLSNVGKFSKGKVSLMIDGEEFTREFKNEKAGIVSMADDNYAVLNKTPYYDSLNISVEFKNIDKGINAICVITIYSKNKIEEGIYPYNFSLESLDKGATINLHYSDLSYYSSSQKGFVKITKIDHKRNFIEGEFEGELEQGNTEKKKHITNGKFSVNFS